MSWQKVLFIVIVWYFIGNLNPSTVDKDLKAGTNLELPTWLVQEMSSGRQPIVAPELPKIYKESYREILKADPSAVDLHKLNLYFYELGSHVKYFDRKGDVQEILLYVSSLYIPISRGVYTN